MRQGCEIAGGAHGALGGNHRQYIMVEQREQHFHHQRTDAGIADGQAIGLEQHDAASDGCRQRFAHAAGMTAHQVVLQLDELVAGDVLAGEGAEAGIDAIAHPLRVNDTAHCIHTRLHLAARTVGKLHLRVRGLEFGQRLEGEINAGEAQAGHVFFP